MNYTERCYQVALNLVPGIGHRLIKQLISYRGAASEVFSSNLKQLSRIPGIGTINAQAILTNKNFEEANDIIQQAKANGLHLHFYLDDDYPRNLKSIIDAPSLLFSSGKLPISSRKVIAIVGTRRATSYGKDVTENIVRDLTKHDPIIVSGMAYGIDITAHKAALSNGLPTLGILAGGLDYIYPKIHERVAQSIVNNNGALLSEYPIGIKPDPRYFPARNRIIAGIADAVIVIEAATKGGALITANIADSYNKDVFAIPGNIVNTYSAGCNQLILRHKANMYTCIEDLEKQLGWDSIANASTKLNCWEIDEAKWSKDELKLIKLLSTQSKGLHIDKLSIDSQISINQVASLLLSMEFKGIVKALPGKRFKLT